jgi:hypothetical protein
VLDKIRKTGVKTVVGEVEVTAKVDGEAEVENRNEEKELEAVPVAIVRGVVEVLTCEEDEEEEEEDDDEAAEDEGNNSK